ncbi:MAG: hypothetical protein JO326_06930 [Acetobacteraceae bacterium]|nr:hypothetical protein [Acetobacteraceae bacterium]
MNPSPILSPTGQLAQIVSDLQGAAGARLERAGPLAWLFTLVARRLAGLCARFGRLAHHLAAGALRVRARAEAPLRHVPADTASAPTAPPPAAATAAAPSKRIPTRVGWLLDLLGVPAEEGRAKLLALLADPASRAEIAATPQLHRPLRGLCRALRVRLIPELRRPRRRRPRPFVARRAAPPPTPEPPPPASDWPAAVHPSSPAWHPTLVQPPTRHYSEDEIWRAGPADPAFHYRIARALLWRKQREEREARFRDAFSRFRIV